MAKVVEVLITILDEDEKAFKIKSEDGNIQWVLKSVISDDSHGKVGETVIFDLPEYLAIRSHLV